MINNFCIQTSLMPTRSMAVPQSGQAARELTHDHEHSEGLQRNGFATEEIYAS